MAKRVWSIGIILFLLIIIIVGYLLLKGRLIQQEDPYKAVPLDASLVIEVKDFHNFVEKLCAENMIWNELCQIEAVQNSDNEIRYIDSLVRSDRDLNNLFYHKSFLFAIHQTGKNDLELLYLMNLSGNSNASSLKGAFEKVLSSSVKIQERTYHKTRIFDIINSTTGRKFSYSLYKGIFMFSSSSILLESAIRQLDLSKSIIEQEGFIEVKNTAGRVVDGNIYINCRNMPRFISVFLNNTYKNILLPFTHFADWAELDINIEDNSILLNGFTYSNDSLNNYLNLFHKQSPRKMIMDQTLPANTMTYITFGLDDFELFQTSYEDYLKESGKFNSYERNLNEANKTWGVDINKILLPLLENEIGIAYTNIKNLSYSQNTYVLFSVKSISQAKEEVLKALETYVEKNGTQIEKYVHTVEVDQETHFQIFKLPVAGIPGILFGDMFKGADNQLITFIDGFLVFGNSIPALKTFIHYNLLQKTLANDFDYRFFKESLSSRSNFYFYLNVPRSFSFLSRYLNSEYEEGLNKYPQLFQKIQALGVQFSSENTMIYNNIYLKYQSVFREKAETQWESLLDTTLRSKPFFVTNHYTHEKEIFIQDEKNNIYLINSAGRILWRVGLSEKILSEVVQIDYYKNDKLQLLFNTKNFIHLIDRNGNYVEKYPVKLRSVATNGLSLFDYAQDKDYRFCLAGKDKKVYLFSQEGNTVKGWSLPQTESIIKTPVHHFRVGTKDYIVLSDNYKFYILNRKGNTRINIRKSIQKPIHQNILIDRRTSGTRFVTTGKNGTVYFIYLDGKVEEKVLGKFSHEHFFEYKDIDGNGTKEFIFLDQDKLLVYASSGKQIFSFTFDNIITLKPVIYTFSSTDMKIGIVSLADHKIYLFNNNGNLYKNFPLTGQTLFSIGRFRNSGNKFNLIVGGDDNFLYNYSVQ